MGSQPYTKNYGQPRKSGSRRGGLPQERAQNIGCPNSPENMHTSTIIQIEEVVFRTFSLLIE